MNNTLDKTLRAKLERTIKAARDVAESAARAALEQLGVGEPNAFAHLSDHERQLRRELRIHGRQLGDSLNGGKTQSMDRLVEEVAYEHWHRMLFARFLAENNLLMYPDPDAPVAVTLEECEDLAADEGAANGWELASRYASRMLPQIFRLDSPVFQLTQPPEHQHRLERLLADLPLEVFTASDSLGWVYQFWQAKKKEEVNASEVKIGARELPSVTQLFTEPYMVSFLLDNSLGAWWAARRLSERDFQTATSEEELRRKAAIREVSLASLRFVQQDEGSWAPAAGTFESWPAHLSELKTLDPCCGSGHFLVAALLMLVPMRMELEGLSAREAVDAVLRQNIHGLELDQRCVELAAFALALTAWKYPEAGGYRVLPELQVACSGLSISVKREEWLALAGKDTTLRQALGELYTHFSEAPVLGSLINPESSLRKNDLFELKGDDVRPLLAMALEGDKDDEKTEMGVIAQGLAKAATLLGDKYHWVITNVPYLARGKQCDSLRLFCEQHYPEAKNDLATVFLDRCLEFCVEGGTTSIVLPQNWLFLSTYQKFRKKLLKNDTWHLIARLGPQAFQTPMWDFNVQLITLSKGNRNQASLLGRSNSLSGLDVSEPRTATEKALGLLTAEIKSVEQAKQLANPDARIALEDADDIELLSQYGSDCSGCLTGDGERFYRLYWELNITDDWAFLQSTVSDTISHHGRNQVILWEKGRGALYLLADEMKGSNHAVQNWRRGQDVWGKKGVAISSMRQLPSTFYDGFHFDNNTAVIVPKNQSHLNAIWCFCSSPEYNEAVRRIDQKLNVTNATLVKVPFDLDRWTKVSEERYPNGLPKPFSDDPTQWIFHGHPCGSVVWDEASKWTTSGSLRSDSIVLHIAVARLLGYRWPAELDPAMELANEQREWVNRCEALLPYADGDGIVCIPPVRGEASAADRLLNLLAAAYGDVWSTDMQAQLLNSADHAGKTLETWLREKFFTQHCKLFQHRPFIWHIWDGLRDGFAALVNYHKLDYKNLETLIYTYLGDWISRQKQDITAGVDGAEERLAAAEALKKKLELILEGENPYDIFVRWKPLDQQPIGWNPDLNDGVRLNIRPFLTVPDVGKKG
ncbi:MAG: N-6 DNA methylase, partial [Verrucomicrobiae bacterium]